MRPFFRMWVVYLSTALFAVPFAVFIWGVGTLLDAFHVPWWMGLMFLMIGATALPAWMMTSTHVKRGIVAIITWAEHGEPRR